MTNLLGAAELPLALVLWMVAGAMVLIVVLTLIAFVGGAISQYNKHKQQLKWDQMVKGIRR